MFCHKLYSGPKNTQVQKHITVMSERPRISLLKFFLFSTKNGIEKRRGRKNTYPPILRPSAKPESRRCRLTRTTIRNFVYFTLPSLIANNRMPPRIIKPARMSADIYNPWIILKARITAQVSSVTNPT